MFDRARSSSTRWALGLLLALGCGTTRMSDTQRTATEQLLISNAVDKAVSQIDFRSLSGKPVFFDPQYLDNTVDKGYVISSLRQQLLANGCVLQEDRAKATYVVEARAGGVGTDRHSVLVGVPEMNVPSLLPGQPSHIPKIPFAEKTDQNGVAKVAVFAYNRKTGRPVWQSGVVEAVSSARDTWLLGAGPFRKGTIRHGTEFAGQPIPLPAFGEEKDSAPRDKIQVTQAAAWEEPTTQPAVAQQLAELLGTASLTSPLTIRELLRAQLAKLAPPTEPKTEAKPKEPPPKKPTVEEATHVSARP